MIQRIDDRSRVGNQSRVGIISYSNNIRYVANLTDSLPRHDLITKINASTHQGSITRMRAAVTAAKEQLQSARDGVSKAVILFTDGEPHDYNDPSETQSMVLNELKQLMDAEIFVYVIGVHNVNMTFLRTVESYSEFGFAETADSFGSLTQYPDNVISSLDIRCIAARTYTQNDNRLAFIR